MTINLELSRAIYCQQGDGPPRGAESDVAEHLGVIYYTYHVYIQILKRHSDLALLRFQSGSSSVHCISLTKSSL